MSFGENLRKFRGELGITQEELAQKVCISTQAVSKWERGESMPDTATLPAVADAIGVSLDRLFDRKSESIRDLAHHIRAFMNGGDRVRDVRRIAYIAACGNADTPCGKLDAAELSHMVADVGNDGFVIGSNSAELPFLGIFEEPEIGWKSSLSNIDAYRRIFSALSAPGVIEAVRRISEYESITFDAAYAESSLGIDADMLESLGKLGMFWVWEAEINGTVTTLYRSRPNENMIALLILAEFIAKDGIHQDFGCCHRDVPLIR